MTLRFLYVSVALLAMVATSALFYVLLPPAIPRSVAAKLEFFAKHKDEFDTLFLGTSCIYYGVSPEIFDQTTRENGLVTRTFNFGIDAMAPPENFYVLEQILKTKPRNLKWVFLEVDDLQTKSPKTLGTERAVYWHDWTRTALMLRKTYHPRGDVKWYTGISRLWHARRDFSRHLLLFARQFANVGRADVLSWHDRERSAGADMELGPRRDGYRLAGGPMSAEDGARFQQRLAQEVAQAQPRPLDPYAEEAYRDFARQIRQGGAVPVFLVTPIIFQSARSFGELPPPGRLLAFNDCNTYPALFDPKVRIDEVHLTRVGAEEFTRLLAREFVRQSRQP